LHVHIYAKLHNFIQLSLTLPKLWHFKRDHPVIFFAFCKKNAKLRFLCNNMTDLHKIWRNDAERVYSAWILNVSISEIQDDRQHENPKISISDDEADPGYQRVGGPPSWIFEIKLFNGQRTLVAHICTIVPNFLEIGHTVAEISHFFALFY